MPNIPGQADHAGPAPSFVQRARKFVVAAAGVAAMVVTTGVLEENIEIWVNAALALATAAGVYSAKNDRPAA
jgi:hypothetical protein